MVMVMVMVMVMMMMIMMMMMMMMMMRFVEWHMSRTSNQYYQKKPCRISNITEITCRISNMSRNITEGLVVNYSNPS